jgi:hypothetical protein
VCRNGLVAYANAFQSQLAVGKQADSVIHSIARALDSYSNDEGYAAIQQRLDASTKSWASIRETANLYKLLAKLLTHDHVRRAVPADDQPATEAPDGVLHSYTRLTGDMAEMYGLASVETLPVKRQGVLPAKCSMYDLLNFATEVATHRTVTPFGKLQLQAWVGRTIADRNGFDLEGTRERFGDFAEFHTNVRLANQLTGSKIDGGLRGDLPRNSRREQRNGHSQTFHRPQGRLSPFQRRPGCRRVRRRLPVRE